MDTAIVAALGATAGFAGGDVITALLVRKVSAKAGFLLLSCLKLFLYVPFAVLLWREFQVIDGQTIAWILLLGALFATAYWGFNRALEVSKNPALAGVVAGCFPASASFVAIVFLGQRPSVATIVLLCTVLVGVILIGLADNWRASLRLDKGIALALIPLVCWGVFGALLHEPVQHLRTPHAWFVVQVMVAAFVAVSVGLLYHRQAPGILSQTRRKRAWWLVLGAGLAIGLSELLQAFALGSGQQIVIIEAVLGGYPAVYFLIAHHVFKEPLVLRQWLGIALAAISIVLLSVLGASI